MTTRAQCPTCNGPNGIVGLLSVYPCEQCEAAPAVENGYGYGYGLGDGEPTRCAIQVGDMVKFANGSFRPLRITAIEDKTVTLENELGFGFASLDFVEQKMVRL